MQLLGNKRLYFMKVMILNWTTEFLKLSVTLRDLLIYIMHTNSVPDFIFLFWFVTSLTPTVIKILTLLY